MYVVLLIITMLAAGLRFYHIDRLPPGLHYDEAFNNLLALRLPQWKPFPPFFFDVEFGRCVMHPYLIALLFQATGPILLGGRLVSALAGALTVPLLFFAVREIFRRDIGEQKAMSLGIASALSLTVLYWHVHLSRIGMELVLSPLFIVLACGATWRALRRRRFWDAAIAGILLGLLLYTYPIAIFAPVLLGLFFGYRAVFEHGFLKANWRTLTIITCVALLTLAPLIHFFVAHPHWLTVRSSQIASDNPLQGIGKVVKGFFIQGAGDTNHRQNLPGRPVLDHIQAVLFILGLGACVVRRRSSHLFLLCWLAMMLLPSVLTEHPPHSRRMSGAAPAVAALIGLGAMTIYESGISLTRHWFPRARRAVSIGLVLLLILAFTSIGAHTAHDYFLVWGQSEGLFIAFDVGLRQIGEYITTLSPEEPVYISPIYRSYPTLAFLLNDKPDRIQSYNGRRCLVYPAATDVTTTHIIILLDDQESLPALKAAFPEGQVVQKWYMGDTLYAAAYRTPAGSSAQIGLTHELETNFGGKIRLLGYDEPADTFVPGDTIPLRLYWQAKSDMAERYKVFVHLWGASDSSEGKSIWGQEDVRPCDNSYDTSWWAEGEIVADGHRIPIDPETPPGEYQILVGFYLENGPRLPVLDAAGQSIDDHVAVTTVHIAAP